MYKSLIFKLDDNGGKLEGDAADAIDRLEKKTEKQKKEIVRLTQKVNMLLKDHDNQSKKIAELREDYHAAVKDIYLLGEDESVCTICAGSCSNDGTCNFEWRGVKNE